MVSMEGGEGEGGGLRAWKEVRVREGDCEHGRR